MRLKIPRMCLRKISIGKYNSKFYTKGNAADSSSIGGLITILIGITIVLYAIYAIKGLFHNHKYNLEEETIEI